MAESEKRPALKVVRKFLQQAIPAWDLQLSVQAPSQNDKDVHIETGSNTPRGETRKGYVDELLEPNAKVVSAIVIETSFFFQLNSGLGFWHPNYRTTLHCRGGGYSLNHNRP
jgi:hypothetical protein